MTLPPRLKKLLYPGPLWLVVLVALGGALYLTFFHSLEDTPFAYVSYVLSAYALVIACAFVGWDMRKNLRTAVHGNSFLHRHLTDLPSKTYVSLDLSLAVNLAFAAVKLVTALVSMLTLETVMLTQLNQVQGPAFQRRIMAPTGGCVCLLMSVIALGMIVRSTRRLRALGQNPAEP